MFQNPRKFGIISAIIFCFVTTTYAELKFTNLICKSLNEKLLHIPVCQIKAIGRGVNEINIVVQLKEPWLDITANMQTFKKANGYKPWLYNVTLDICKFLRHKNSPVVDFFYNLVKDNSNANHSCPYTNEIIVKNWRLNRAKITLPMPYGSYMFRGYFITNGKPSISVDVYMDIKIKDFE